MPRDGYLNLTADLKTIESIDEIKKYEECATRPEVIRLLVRHYKRTTGFDKDVNPKNAVFQILSGLLPYTTLKNIMPCF